MGMLTVVCVETGMVSVTVVVMVSKRRDVEAGCRLVGRSKSRGFEVLGKNRSRAAAATTSTTTSTLSGVNGLGGVPARLWWPCISKQ